MKRTQKKFSKCVEDELLSDSSIVLAQKSFKKEIQGFYPIFIKDDRNYYYSPQQHFNNEESSYMILKIHQKNYIKYTFCKIYKQESDSEYKISETSESEKQKSKSFWSLKGLSFQIKTLVKELKSTTYKELAKILIEKLQNELQKIHSTERRKEIQNLKRRVYDAINVMVALGVLEKDKKQISFHEQKDKEVVNFQKEQVRTKLEILKEKRRKLTKATLTYMMYKQLIQRNQQIKMESESILYTPVFAFSVQLFENDLCMQQKNGKKLIIKSKQPIQIYSELEVLQKILN